MHSIIVFHWVIRYEWWKHKKDRVMSTKAKSQCHGTTGFWQVALLRISSDFAWESVFCTLKVIFWFGCWIRFAENYLEFLKLTSQNKLRESELHNFWWNHLRCVLVEGYEGRLRDGDVLLAAGHHGDGGEVLDVTPGQMSDVCHHLLDIAWMSELSDAKPSLLSLTVCISLSWELLYCVFTNRLLTVLRPTRLVPPPPRM